MSLKEHNLTIKRHTLVCLCVQIPVRSYSGGGVVVFHPDHHLLIHCQLGGLPDGGEDGVSHRERGRPGETVRDLLWNAGLWIHQRVLQGNYFFRQIQNTNVMFKNPTDDNIMATQKCVRVFATHATPPITQGRKQRDLDISNIL